MSLDVPVFHLKILKRHFYYFIAALVVIIGASLFLVGFLDVTLPTNRMSTQVNWILLGVFLLITIVWGQQNKKVLQSVLAVQDPGEIFARYERYRHLLGNNQQESFFLYPDHTSGVITYFLSQQKTDNKRA